MNIELKFWRYLSNSADACFTVGLLFWLLFSLAMLLVFILLTPILMWLPVRESRIRPLTEYITEAVDQWCEDVKKAKAPTSKGVGK